MKKMRITPEIKLTLDEIKAATNATCAYEKNVAIGAIVTSSKEAHPGDLLSLCPEKEKTERSI